MSLIFFIVTNKNAKTGKINDTTFSGPDYKILLGPFLKSRQGQKQIQCRVQEGQRDRGTDVVLLLVSHY